MGPSAILDVMMKVNSAGAMSELRRFDSALRRTDKTTATATARTSTLGKATGRAGQAMRSAARYAVGAAAAYVSISQAKAAITTTQDLAKTTAGLNRNLGLTVKNASQWASIAKSRDIDPKALTLSFTTLSRRLTDTAHALHEGGGAAESAMVPFTRLGISQADVVAGSKDLATFLPKLAESFGKAEGGAKRQASAQQLLGRGYSTILPLFADGAEGLREQAEWADKYGTTLTKKTLRAQMDLVMAQRETKVAFLGLQIAFAEHLTPALQRANEEFQKISAIMADKKLTSEEKWKQVGAIIGKWADKALEAFVNMLPKLIEQAGQMAPKIAAAFVQGFLNAPILGQFLLGTWLLNRFSALVPMVTAAGSKVGGGLAIGIMAGVAGALAIADIVTSLTAGKEKEAAFEAGGALGGAIAGGIVGSVVPVVGTALGAALGALGGAKIGGMLEELFKPDRRMQERIAETAKQAASAYRRQATAMDVLRDSSRGLRRAREDEQAAARRVERAEERRNDALRQYGRHSPQVVEAEKDLARARNGLARATNRAERAEKLHGIEKKAAKAVTRDAVAAAKDEIWTLQKEVKNRREAFQAAKRANEGEAQAGKRLLDAQNRLREATGRLHSAMAEAAQTIGPRFARSLKEIDSEAKQANQAMAHAKRTVGDARKEMGAAATQGARLGSRLEGIAKTAKNPLTPNMRTASGMVSRFGTAFTNSAQTGYEGMSNIASNVGRMAKGLNGETPTFGLKSPKGGGGRGPGQRPGAQRGWHVPGSGVGDKVPAMLEPGEFVLNRKAVDAIGAANLERFNFDVAPRFAAGGIVELGRQLQREGYEVGENPAFGGVDPVHVAGSYHYSGQALDVNDDVAPFASGSGEPGSLDRLYARLKNLAGVVELLWRVPNHYDHLHVAMAEGASGRLAGVGGQLAQIERQLVTGPDGALKDMAQGAIDTTRDMANDYLKSFGGSTGGFGGSDTYNVRTLEQLWTAVNRGLADAHIMAAIAMGESGGNPRAVGHDPGGTTGLGLWQITTGYNDALIARLGGVNAMLDPVKNARAAGDIFRSQGYGAWVVYNEGIYQRWMRNGGLVEMLQGGGGAGKGGKGGGKGGKKDGRDDMNLTVTGGGPGGSAMNIFSPDLPGVGGYGYAGGPTTPPGQYVPAVDTLPDIQALMNAIWLANGNDGRRKALDGALGQLRAWGLAADKMKQIEDLTLAADTYGAWADRASATVDDDALPGSGVLNGATEVEHLTNQLTRLFELRNALIDAELLLDDKVRKMVDFIAKVKAKMVEIKAKIDKVAKERKRVLDEIQKIKDDKKRDEDDVKKWEGKLAEELKRKPKDQDQGRIKDLREKIWAGRARIANAPKKIADKQREIDKIDREQDKRDWQLNTALEQMRTTSEDDRLSELVGQQEDMRSRLQTVQDLGSPMDNMPLAQAAAMPFGTFGGQIFDAQQRLRDIAAARSEQTDPEKIEPLHIADLLEFAQAVSLGVFRQRGGVIPAYATGGLHAAGGLALVGERGPELASLPAGTRVHSNSDSQSMLSPTIYADIYIGGEKIAERVQMELRDRDSATLSSWRAGVVRR